MKNTLVVAGRSEEYVSGSRLMVSLEIIISFINKSDSHRVNKPGVNPGARER